MHASWAAVLLAATLGVDVGWQPIEDGSIEYIIQIEPELAARLKEGDVVDIGVRPALRNVRRYRIVVGRQPLPRDLGDANAAPPAGPQPASSLPAAEPAPAAPATSPPADSDSDSGTADYQPPVYEPTPYEPQPAADQPGKETGLLDDDSRPTPPPLLTPPGGPAASGDPFASSPPAEVPAAAGDAPESGPPESGPEETSPMPADTAPADTTPAVPGYEPATTPGGYQPYVPPGADPGAATDVEVPQPSGAFPLPEGFAPADDSAATPGSSFPLGPRPSSDTGTDASAPVERRFDDHVTPVNGVKEADEQPGQQEGPATSTASTTTTSSKATSVSKSPNPDDQAEAAKEPTDEQHEGGAAAVVAGEPEKPWGLLIGSWFLLFVSVGANAFLVWIAWEARSRLRAMLDRSKLTQTPAVI